MIFVSHNFKDKAIVEQFALRLRETFGEDKVFYDSWSIQPGDGIIDKMNQGLANCKLFLFFVSKNSLQSKMVAMEWQNAIVKASKGQTKIIPVRIDNSSMPEIMLQTLYIDLYTNGIEVALRQIVDVTSGKSTFTPGFKEFSNLHAYVYQDKEDVLVEIRALHYMEPIARFVVLTRNKEEDISFSLEGSGMHEAGFNKDVNLDGVICNGQLMATERAVVPGFPFIVRIKRNGGVVFDFLGVLHQKSASSWQPIPASQGKPS